MSTPDPSRCASRSVCSRSPHPAIGEIRDEIRLGAGHAVDRSDLHATDTGGSQRLELGGQSRLVDGAAHPPPAGPGPHVVRHRRPRQARRRATLGLDRRQRCGRRHRERDERGEERRQFPGGSGHGSHTLLEPETRADRPVAQPHPLWITKRAAHLVPADDTSWLPARAQVVSHAGTDIRRARRARPMRAGARSCSP